MATFHEPGEFADPWQVKVSGCGQSGAWRKNLGTERQNTRTDRHNVTNARTAAKTLLGYSETELDVSFKGEGKEKPRDLHLRHNGST